MKDKDTLQMMDEFIYKIQEIDEIYCNLARQRDNTNLTGPFFNMFSL